MSLVEEQPGSYGITVIEGGTGLDSARSTDQLVLQTETEEELNLVEQLLSGLSTPGFIDDPFHIRADLDRSLEEQDLEMVIANADRLTYDHFFPIMRRFPLAFTRDEYENPSNMLHSFRSDDSMKVQLFNLTQDYYEGYETDGYIVTAFTEEEFAAFLRVYSNPITFRTRFGKEFKGIESKIYGKQSHVVDVLETIKTDALLELERRRGKDEINTEELIV